MLRASLPLMTAIKPSIESSRRNRGQSSPSTSTPINNTRPHSSLPPSRPSPSSTPNIINTTLSTTQPSAQSINTQPRRSNNRHSSHPIPRSSYNTRSKSRQSHIHSNNSSSSGRGLHTRRSIASAFYAGPAEKDRFVHTAHVRAESSASGFHSPRHIAYLQLSPRGAQPQRHIAIQRRQRQQRQHQQQQQFSLSQHHYRLYQQLQQGQDFYSSKPSTVSPSESVSVVSPLIVPRPSSMPLDYTRSFEKQGQEEAATTMSQWRSQQPRRHPMGLERDRDATLDPSQPDAYLIHERLLDLQELQLHKEKQLEQRQMQAYRIQKFSDSNNIDFDYRGSSIFKESQKEGFESYWGESIGVDKEATELHPGPGDNHERQESGYGLNVAMDNEQRERERKEQRTQQHELELMETDMETEKTGDDDMYEGMEPQIRLEHARWAKEEAIRQYQRAGRSLQRAREREEAIKYEYEVDLFEVGVESSVSQQGHRRQRPGDYILSTFEQLQQHEETRSRHSSPTTTAAAAAAATYQVQDDTNLEAMLSSRVVPQVSDNLSAMSETPRLHLGDISTPQIIKAPPPPEPASGLERPTRMSTPKARDEIQEKDRSRSKSQVRGRAQSEPMENVHTFHYRHASRSPNIKIKSEEFEEAFFRKYPLGNERRDGKGLRRQSPKYQDFDVTIHIPSSIGSEVGRNGQPESSNAQRQGKTARRHPPERWRSPTPAPISIHTKRMARCQRTTREPTRPPLRSGASESFAPKTEPVSSGIQGEPLQRPHGKSAFRPVLLPPPRASASRLRPYPIPSHLSEKSQHPQSQEGHSNFPPNFFAKGIPARSLNQMQQQQQQQQQQRRQEQGQEYEGDESFPRATSDANPVGASAFNEPGLASGYASMSRPQTPWQVPTFVDENGNPYPATVIIYNHYDRVDNIYHQYYPESLSLRNVSKPPIASRATHGYFEETNGEEGEGRGSGRREDGERHYEDMVMDNDHDEDNDRYQYWRRQSRSRSRTASRQGVRREREGERRKEGRGGGREEEEEAYEEKPKPKPESPRL